MGRHEEFTADMILTGNANGAKKFEGLKDR